MGYQQAVEKAWDVLSGFPQDGKTVNVKLLADTYTIDLKAKTIFSDSCNVPAKEYISILLLHYLKRTKEAGNLPPLTGEWIDFNELEGGEGYYAAFRKRTIDCILKKYGSEPAAIKRTLDRLPGELSDKGDVSIIIHPFNEIAMLITLSKADDEFGPDANILFDKNISGIFCTEDIVVLTEMVVHSL